MAQGERVSDTGLAAIAKYLIFLRRLELHWCPLVTDLGVGHLIDELKNLSYISLRHCSRLTDALLPPLITAALSRCNQTTVGKGPLIVDLRETRLTKSACAHAKASAGRAINISV